MKKLLFLALLVLILSASLTVAFADDSSTTPASTTVTPVTQPTGSTSVTTSAGINKNDPLYLDIKAKYQTLLGLRQTESQVWDSIKAQSASNGTTEKQLRDNLKAKIQSARDSLKSQVQATQDQIKPLLDQAKSLRDQIAAARKSKDTNTVSSLKSQLTDIQNQIKTLRANIQTTRDNAKSSIASEKAVMDSIKQATVQIKALQQQMLQISADIHTIQVTKDKEWISFASSMKAADLAGADTNMANILTYKQQIIDKLNSVLDLKKQVAGILSGLNTDNTTTTTTTTTTDTAPTGN